MKRMIALFVGLILTFGGATAAHAGGSDSPPPYTVDNTGITLPAGVTFQDGGHVNIKLVDGTSLGIHFEALNNQPSGEWIGKSFLPWSAFGVTAGCFSWVQVWLYNEHYGEAGQPPVCIGTPPVDPPVEPPVDPPVDPPVEPPVVVPPVDPPLVPPVTEEPEELVVPTLAPTGLDQRQEAAIITWLVLLMVVGVGMVITAAIRRK